MSVRNEVTSTILSHELPASSRTSRTFSKHERICVSIGALITVAVAFTCPLRSSTRQARQEKSVGEPPRVDVSIPREWFDRPAEQRAALSFSVDEQRGPGLHVIIVSVHETVPGFD